MACVLQLPPFIWHNQLFNLNHSVFRNFIFGSQFNDLKYTIDIHMQNLNYVGVKPLERKRDKTEILTLSKLKIGMSVHYWNSSMPLMTTCFWLISITRKIIQTGNKQNSEFSLHPNNQYTFPNCNCEDNLLYWQMHT